MPILVGRRTSSSAAWSRLVVVWTALLTFTSRGICAAQPTFPTSAPAIPAVPSDSTGSAAPAPLSSGELDCSFQGDPIWLSDAISFQHVLNPVENTLTVELTYQGTAWIGFGISADGQMVGSEVIIAKPGEAPSSSNPGKYRISARQQDAIQLSDRQTLVNASFEQSGGTTVLRFTKALVESGELPISAEGTNTFVYAVGSSNVFGYHAQRGSFTIASLTRCLGHGYTATPIAAPTADPSNPTTPSPTVYDGQCAPAVNDVNRCTNRTGNMSACVACFDEYIMDAPATGECEDELAVTCGVEAACPDCGTCQRELLTLLNCANFGFCEAVFECPISAAAPCRRSRLTEATLAVFAGVLVTALCLVYDV